MDRKNLSTQLTDHGVGPGFFQTEGQHGAVGGPNLAGRKSGRVAPRAHVRQPAHEDTLQRHDLLPMHDSQVGSNSAFDRNQGQLFNPQETAPRSTMTDQARARAAGAPTGDISINGVTKTGLAAQPGFLPTLTPKQKIAGLKNAERSRVETGASRGTGTTNEMMQDRAALSSKGKNESWYMGTDSAGQHNRNIPGEAATQVHAAAARQGETGSAMARAVAFTSPQMGWKSEGSTDSPTSPQRDRMEATAGSFPNLSAAENVVRETKGAMRNGDPTPEQINDIGNRASSAPNDSVVFQGHNKHGVALPPNPQTLNANAYALSEMGSKTSNEMFNRQSGGGVGAFPVKGVTSQKAPNFDASLNLSHVDPAVQRIAAQSYTVDRHDAAAVGIDGDKGLGLRGVYEVTAMTGRRTALKNRQLPPNEQASEWEAMRQSKGLGTGNSMFESPTNTNVRKDLSQPVSNSQFTDHMSRSQRRNQSTAEKFGLEF